MARTDLPPSWFTCIIRAAQDPSSSMTIDFSKFATDDPDAAVRAARYANEDPLSSVPCALLSSAEIHDYPRITGMLFPFNPDSLKSASYEAHIGGEFIRWDERDHKHECQVRRGDPLRNP